MTLPWSRAWHDRIERIFGGVLAPRERDEAAAWGTDMMLMIAGTVVTALSPLLVQAAGGGYPAALIVVGAGFTAVVAALTRAGGHRRAAQDLIATRLGLDPRATRILEFRGLATYESALATAIADSARRTAGGGRAQG